MNGQKGMTVVELLVAIAVTGIIVVFLGTAIYQIITVSEYGNDRLTAMHELQNSAHWFNLDGQKAVTADVDGELLLTISETTSITYALVGQELRRTAGGSQMTLARNIASADFSIDNRVITMSLTSAPEGRDNVSENGTYKVYLRPAEGG
ncbi:MAG: prepilin-type N-terminal cleavage/methylation domain-containing protein [Dehalococcoidales bacterium]|nr:prepilin-type N-terminal cleavage/methylation domain-containing protein [Dehalococcoidales bacterium]